MIVSNRAANDIILFLLAAVALIFSIILHELAHGYVALKNGDRTAKFAGRLTFNPAKHFDILGILMLLFMRVGYAKPVPVNPNNFKNRRLGFFTVSIAGVTVNLILSFVFSFVYVLLNNLASKNGFIIALTFFSYYVALYNLFLCFFNLLPLYPLDGYNLLESIFGFKNSIVRFLRNYGMMILFALFALSILVDMLPIPGWFNLLGVYLDNTAGLIFDLFKKLWIWILRL